MRKGKAAERKLDVRWSTTEWAPSIKWEAQQQEAGVGEHLELWDGLPLRRRPAPRKTKYVLWMRTINRSMTARNIGLTGLNGSRTSWR